MWLKPFLKYFHKHFVSFALNEQENIIKILNLLKFEFSFWTVDELLFTRDGEVVDNWIIWFGQTFNFSTMMNSVKNIFEYPINTPYNSFRILLKSFVFFFWFSSNPLLFRRIIFWMLLHLSRNILFFSSNVLNLFFTDINSTIRWF